MKRLALAAAAILAFVALSAQADEAVCRDWTAKKEDLPRGTRVIAVDGMTVGTFAITEAGIREPATIQGHLCGPDKQGLGERYFTLVRYDGNVPPEKERLNPHREDIEDAETKDGSSDGSITVEGTPRRIRTHSDGSFRVVGLRTGKYALVADPDLFSSRQYLLFDFIILPDPKSAELSNRQGASFGR